MLRALGQARRSAELHRQHRRAGGRRGGGLPLPGKEDAGRSAGADRRPGRRFDYYCWDLYARTSRYYKDHPEALALARRDAARDRSRRRAKSPNWRTWWPMPSCSAHLATMLRLDVEYDVLPRESEILHLQVLGVGVRAAEGAQGDLLRDRGQERRLLGDAGAAFSTKRIGRAR